MRRIVLITIITLLIVSGFFAVLYVTERPAMDKAMQGDGNGIFFEKKRTKTAVNAWAAEVWGQKPWDDSNRVNDRASGETTEVSGSPWENRLLKVIEDSVRVIKKLPSSLGHRTPPPPRLAPPGVYFTLQPLSVRNPSGITGIRAGTRVVCIKDQGAVLLVKMGDLEFEAKRQYLTHDLDLADLASRDDDQARQAVARSIAEQQAMVHARQDEENAAFERRQREIEAEKAAAAKASGYSNPLERGSYNDVSPK